jgi:hypothetical protein
MSAGDCLCCKQSGVCCKLVSDDAKSCMLCNSSTVECHTVTSCMSLYYQLCCCELFCSLPFKESGYATAPDLTKVALGKNDGAAVGNVTVCK